MIYRTWEEILALDQKSYEQYVSDKFGSTKRVLNNGNEFVDSLDLLFKGDTPHMMYIDLQVIKEFNIFSPPIDITKIEDGFYQISHIGGPSSEDYKIKTEDKDLITKLDEAAANKYN
jgi:hypothetical protein